MAIPRSSEPANLLAASAHGRGGVVPVLAPGGVAEVDDEIAVVRGHAVGERDSPDGLPVDDVLPLASGEEDEAGFLARVGHGEVEAERALRLGGAPVEDGGPEFRADVGL